MDERNLSAKKYFIFGFKKYIHNEYKQMAKKNTPSIRELLTEIVEIQEDINNTNEEKLKHARNDLVKAANFFVENSIFNNIKSLKKDLNALCNQIEDLKTGGFSQIQLEFKYREIYNSSKALLKKLSYKNLYECLISILIDTRSYYEVDKILESMINELIYDGYSLKYLKEWYKNIAEPKEISADNIDNILLRFNELHAVKKKFIYYVNTSFEREQIKVNNKLILNKVNPDRVNFFDVNLNKDISREFQV